MVQTPGADLGAEKMPICRLPPRAIRKDPLPRGHAWLSQTASGE